MNKLKKTQINASLLRILLSVLILILVAAGAAGLTYGLGVIKKYAVEVSHKKVDASASNDNISSLQEIEQYLQDNDDVLKKIDLLKSDSQFPEFRIVDQVRAAAKKNNLKVGSFSYDGGDSSSGDTESATPETPAPATTTQPATGAETAPVAAASSGKTISLSVTVSGGSYSDFLQFTYDLQQYLPKMKIDGISMSNGGGEASEDGSTPSAAEVSIEPITVEMYIK